MSIFSSQLRPDPMGSDEAVRRYLEAVGHVVEPDPLFRRRLRGTIVNRFVAIREGAVEPTARLGSRMGVLRRACLYASFATGLSVAGVMDASQTAIPGDLLYPLKLSIETARVEVLPEELHDELATYALSERIAELSRLADSGQWARAAALAGAVRESYEELAALSGGDVAPTGLLRAELAQLEKTLDRLPDAARVAVERAMAGAPGLAGTDVWPGSDDRGSPGGSGGGGNGNGQAPSDPGGSAPVDRGQPNREEQPERTPKPERTPMPEPTPKARPDGAKGPNDP